MFRPPLCSRAFAPLAALFAFATATISAQPAAPGSAPATPRAVPAPGPQRTPELVQAVRRGATAHWQALLAHPEALAETDSAGNTALHVAALHFDVVAVKALLAAGAKPNAQNHAGATPLLYGAGHPEIVRALLEHGADPNLASKAKTTPLMAAVSHPESFEAVRLLVAAGADVHAAKGRGGEIILPNAITAGDRRTIDFLIAQGAPLNPAAGRSPLIDAVQTGDTTLVELLLDRGVNLDYDSRFAGHALNHALYSQQPDVAQLLIARGASLTHRSSRGPGTPPMLWAAYNNDGNPAVAQALVAAGADINITDADGSTALSHARRLGPHTPLVRYLEGLGAKAPTAARLKPVPHRPVEATSDARTAAIRERMPATLNLLARSSAAFLDNKFVRQQKCSSCHQQDLPAVAFDLARHRGFTVEDADLGRLLHARVTHWAEPAVNALEMSAPLPDFSVSLGYGLIGLHALGYARDDMTDGLVHYLLRTQRGDGSWPIFDYRPPMEDGPVMCTAWSAYALRHYAPRHRGREAAAAAARAAAWLRAQTPRTPNDAVFQLLGLSWAGATAAQLRDPAAALVSTQRPDGGWAQLPGRESDAWATGTTLFALLTAGSIAPTDPVYLRGVDFLLRTQFEDGSWWVRSRSWPFQPHFNGQFPHGKDQWISAGATAWAAIALLQTLPAVEPARPFATPAQLTARYVRQGEAGTERKRVSTSAPPTAPGVAGPSGRPAAVDFSRDIRPLLERSCAGCHGDEKPRAGLNVLTRATLLKGGASGETAVAPGDVPNSLLLSYVTDQIEDLEMPPLERREKYPKLNEQEVALLRTWIEAGAPDAAEAKRTGQ